MTNLSSHSPTHTQTHHHANLQCHLTHLRFLFPATNLSAPDAIPAHVPVSSPPVSHSSQAIALSIPISFLNFLTRTTVHPVYRMLAGNSPVSPRTVLPAPSLLSTPTVPGVSSSKPIQFVDPPAPGDHLTFSTKSRYPQPRPLAPLPKAPHEPRLLHVSLLARHGTRNPTNNSLARMTALNTWLHTVLPHRPVWLREFDTNLAQYRSGPGALTSHGVGDLYAIASRFARLYAPALSQRNQHTLRIRSSYKDRAIASANAFLEGYLDACRADALQQPVMLLFQSREASDPSSPNESSSRPSSPLCSVSSSDIDIDESELLGPTVCEDESSCVEVLPFGSDAVLRFFERNADYANFAMRHKALTQKELSCGALRHHGAALALRMSAALGINAPMDADLVRAVVESAAFDAAHGRARTSAFCRALNKRDAWLIELFERRHRPFFKAHDRFRTVSAPFVEDLVASLKASAGLPGTEKPVSADLRFAHAETLIPFLLLLGITSNGLDSSDPEYGKGLGAMSPFAANMAIELYETSQPGGGKAHFVRFRLHERYVTRIPALKERGETGVVKLEHLLEFFDSVLDEGLPERR